MIEQQHALDSARKAAADAEQTLCEKEEKLVEARAEVAKAVALHAQIEAAAEVSIPPCMLSLLPRRAIIRLGILY